MSKVCIHQPCYFPYLGIFYKIWLADTFVYLDDAQYSNGYVFDWNRIKTPQGESRLKVPTERHFGDLLTEVKPKDFLGWREKHLKTISMAYKRARFYPALYPRIEAVLSLEYGSLADLNISIMDMFLKWFSLGRTVYRTSKLGITSKAEARVIETCQKVGGNQYISGIGGKNYQTKEHFDHAGITLRYAAFTSIEYRQLWGGPFLGNLSVLDYAMNEGHDLDQIFNKTLEADGEYGR